MHTNYKKSILKPYTSQVIENGIVLLRGGHLGGDRRFQDRMKTYGIETAMGCVMSFTGTPQGSEYWRRFYIFHRH